MLSSWLARWLVCAVSLALLVVGLSLPATTATATAATAGTADADHSDPGGTIYYTYAPGTTLKAWGFTVGETQPFRLTTSPDSIEERHVAVSPDGTKVAVVYSPKGAPATQWGVAVYTRGAAEPDWSVTLEEPQSVTWSPDSRSLAVVAGPGGYSWPAKQSLWTYSADGQGEPKLLETNTSIGYVSFAPDSSKVAAKVQAQGETYMEGINIYDLAAGTKKRVTMSTDMAMGTDPRVKLMAFTPDGANIIYFRKSNTGPELWRSPVDGSLGTKLSVSFETYQRAPMMWGPWIFGFDVNRTPAFLNTETGVTRTVNVPIWQIGDWAPARGATPPPNQPPTIGSTSLVDRFVDLGTEVQLLVSGLADADGQVVQVDTSWGDNATSYSSARDRTELRYVKHTYAAAGTYTITSTARDDDGDYSSPSTVKAYVSKVQAAVEPAQASGSRGVRVDTSGSHLAVPATRTAVTIDGQTTSGTATTVVAPVTQNTGTLVVEVFGTDPETGREVRLGSTTEPYDVRLTSDGQTPGGEIFFVSAYQQEIGTKAFSRTLGSAETPKRVTASAPEVIEQNVTVSPDGKRVAVIQWTYVENGPNSMDEWELAVYDRGSSTPVWKRPMPYAQEINWSPDGRSIAVVSGPASQDQRLEVVSAEGDGPVRRLARMQRILELKWSPDSQQITFAGEDSIRGTYASPDVYIVDVLTAESDYAPFLNGTRNYESSYPIAYAESGDALRYWLSVRTGTNTRAMYVGSQPTDGSPATERPVTKRVGSIGDTTFGPWVLSGATFLNLDSDETVPAWEGDLRAFGGVQDWLHEPGRDSSGTVGPRITVTGAGDDAGDPGCNPSPGDCTLREAINHTNELGATTGIPIIDLPDDQGPIKPTSTLPVIQRPVVIVGGGTPDDVVDQEGHIDRLGDGVLDQCSTAPVVIDGSLAGNGVSGLRINTGLTATRPTVLHRVVLTRFGADGVHVKTSRRVRVQCGGAVANGGAGLGVHDSHDVAAVGEVALADNGGDGVRITGASWRVRTWAGRITGNGGLAVDLADDGVTANDADDPDNGPNTLLNQPVIEAIADDPTNDDPARLMAVVRLPGGSVGRGRVDLYRNAGCDQSGNGELAFWVGGAMTDLKANAGKLVRVSFLDGGDGPLTTTLTSGAGTSEASACRSSGVTPDPMPTGVVDPITTVWPQPGSDTGGAGGGGGAQPGGPGGGSGGNGQYGGDVPPTTGTITRVGPTGTDDPVDGITGGPGTAQDFTVDPYLVSGFAGEVIVEPSPGVLVGLHGGTAPYRVERVAGGTMPSQAWSVDPVTGAVRMDARGLEGGSYTGTFRVRDALDRVTADQQILFVVLDDGPIEADPTPFVTRPDSITAAPGTTVSRTGVRGVLANDTAPTAMTAQKVAGGTLPASAATVGSNGSFTVNITGLAEGVYTFLYRATTSNGLVSPDTLVRVIVDNNNQCPTATPDSYTVRSGEYFSVGAGLGALANDRDREGDTMTAALVGRFSASDIGFRPDGSMWLDARRTSSAHRAFQYRAVDSKGERCDPVWVNIDVVPNQPPDANDNFYVVAAGQRFGLPARGLLGNDFDRDGPELAMKTAVASSITGLSVKNDGSLVYKAPRRLGRYVATYTAKDDLGARSSQAQITFRVVAPADAPPVNRAPIANDDTFYRVHADQALAVSNADGVLANDRDPDGDALYAMANTTAARTRFNLRREGGFLFRPSLSEVGTTLSFTYRAVEKGYNAAVSPVRTVSIQVVAPRERCATIDEKVLTESVSEQERDTLATTSGNYGWCWAGKTITRTGVMNESGGFAKNRRTPGSVTANSEADTVGFYLPFLSIKAIKDNHLSATIGSGAATGYFSTQAEYRSCFNAVDLAMTLTGGLKYVTTALKLVPGGKKLLAKLADVGVSGIIQAVGGLAKQLSSVFKFVSLKDLPDIFGQMLAALDDNGAAGPVMAVLDVFEQTELEVEMDGEPTMLPVGKIIKALVTGSKAIGDIVQSAACIHLSFIPLMGDAGATHDFLVAASETVLDQETVETSDGMFTYRANLGQVLDLHDNSDVEVEWRSDSTQGDTRYVGCDYTRTDPGNQPYAPPQLPGDPARTC